MMEFKAALAAALAKAGIAFDDRQLAQAASFTEQMLEVNKSMNLTAITEVDAVVEKHWLDSLALGRVCLSTGETVLDVGSGAGFPGIPLHIAFPEAKMTLLDSLQKRLSFIEGACKASDIPVPCLLHARAEQAARQKEYREQYDVVISRAVANLSTLCEYCLPFVKVGGKLIAYKGPGAEAELATAQGAIEKLGGKVGEIDCFSLPGGEERNLIYIEKIHSTAPCYPRNAKAIKNKPLLGERLWISEKLTKICW